MEPFAVALPRRGRSHEPPERKDFARPDEHARHFRRGKSRKLTALFSWSRMSTLPSRRRMSEAWRYASTGSGSSRRDRAKGLEQRKSCKCRNAVPFQRESSYVSGHRSQNSLRAIARRLPDSAPGAASPQYPSPSCRAGGRPHAAACPPARGGGRPCTRQENWSFRSPREGCAAVCAISVPRQPEKDIP